MALTTDSVYRVTLMLKDNDENVRGMSLYYSAANTIGNVEAEIQDTIIPAVQGLTDAVITDWTISYGASDYAPLDPPETSDVERKGSFVFRADNGQTVKYEVPSIKNSLVQDGTNVINPAAAEVIAFVTAITTAGVDGLRPTTNVQASLTAQDGFGKKIHRGSSKG